MTRKKKGKRGKEQKGRGEKGARRVEEFCVCVMIWIDITMMTIDDDDGVGCCYSNPSGI